MESALLRSMQLIKKNGEAKSELPIVITKVYVNETCAKLVIKARQFCANVAKGDDEAFGKYDKAISRILSFTPISVLDLKSSISQRALEKEAYSL
jgi:hypothetical protein